VENLTLEEVLELIAQLEAGVEILDSPSPDPVLNSSEMSVEEKINKLFAKNRHLNDVWKLRKQYSAY
jgi:hypothetical protein